MSRQVVCINKDGGNHYDPHDGIQRLGYYVGGFKYFTTRDEMYDYVVGGGLAFVTDGTEIAYLKAYRSARGNKCVKTQHSNPRLHLLNLPEC